MKTILIIEDCSTTAQRMMQSLEGLGTLVSCTRDHKGSGLMPPQVDVEKMIAQADVIVLDGDLGSLGTWALMCPYTSQDLLPFCKGKKVVGVSNKFSFGNAYYLTKMHLTEGDSPENQTFRTLVSSLAR